MEYTIKMLKSIKHFLKKYKLFPLILLPIGIIITLVSKISPTVTERVYSQGIYPILAKTFGLITSFFPFSIYELLIILVILLVFIGIVFSIIYLIRKSRKKENDNNKTDKAGKPKLIIRISCCILSVASVLYFMFVLLCGINYYRVEFSTLSSIEIKKSTKQELFELCKGLANEANSLRENILTDDNGVMALNYSNDDASKKARDAINALNEDYSFMFKSAIKPKSVMFSRLMSYTNITGVYSPITVEANVNVDIMDYDIPATMCHELAHTRGFMREDEANFIGYLACMKSDDINFKYSGTMLALVYSMNRLYSADYDKFSEIYNSYSEGVKADFKANSEYWKKFEGPVAEVSSKVNDSYLKANAQTDGVSSYGRMVDLLLAYYLKSN